MYKLLLIAMLTYAAAQTGLNIQEVLECKSRSCLINVDSKIKKVLKRTEELWILAVAESYSLKETSLSQNYPWYEVIILFFFKLFTF